MSDSGTKKEAFSLGLLFLIAMVLHVLQSVAFGLVGQKGIDVPIEIILVFSEISILLPTLVYVLVKKLSFREDLGFCRIRPGTFFMCILLTALIMPIAAFSNVLSQLFVSNTMVQMSDELLGGSNAAVLFLGSIYGPLCEEFFCRAVFFRRYETIAGPLRAGFISAMLFALAHMNVNQAVYTFVLGFIFAVVNKAAGSVYPSVIIHICINGFNILLLMMATSLSSALGEDTDIAAAAEAARSSDYIYYLIGVTFVIGIICALIAIPCIVFVAKHEENMDDFLKMFTAKFPRNRWLSVPLIIGILFVLFMMFGLEPLLGLFS